ncbi:MAG: hypothetical protein LBS35_06725 [Synergistaceae bacterium]|jgi:hypothetical protein|nr:hypothetical protein [Synergistaceae bacterium]
MSEKARPGFDVAEFLASGTSISSSLGASAELIEKTSSLNVRKLRGAIKRIIGTGRIGTSAPAVWQKCLS